MAPSLLEIAESPAKYVLPPHPAVVEGQGFVFVPLGPGIGAVQRLRLEPSDLDAVRAEVHAIARGRTLERVGWWVSDLTTPPDAAERLGIARTETLAALALTAAPQAELDGYEVREVKTLDDYVAAQDIDASVNGWPIVDRAKHAETWEIARDRFLLWLALDDGRPVGMGRCARSEHALMMIGGSVLPEERGRGVYRALMAARWQGAVARGLPALVTSANERSAPILRTLGFADLGEIAVHVETL